MVNYNSRSDLGWLNNIDSRILSEIKIEFGSVEDLSRVEELVSKQDIVVNLAALISIPYSYKAVQSYFSTNLKGVLNICEAVRQEKNKLIQISTSEVYGTPKLLPITEKNEINPQSPYAASKAAADNVCISYHHSFDLRVNILRPFNTFGPRQSLRAIIPSILNQFISNDGVINVGNLDTKRDFTFVGDTVEGIRSLINKDQIIGETIQLGTGAAYSIREIIKACEEISGVKARVTIDPKRIRPKTSEVEILLSDPTKAKRLLNWKSAISLEDGLQVTHDWYVKNTNLYRDVEQYFV